MKVLVVFTGGTIGCTNTNGILATDKSNSYLLIDLYKKIDGSVEFDCVQPYAILSETLSGESLNALYSCIKSYDLSRFDGVIVTHGTDTLQYSSAFLSYAFSSSITPIVLVSANYPLADKRSNGLDNFAAAVDFIRKNRSKGVFVSYKNGKSAPKIHRASRILPHMPYSDDIYSVFNSFYGEIKNGEFIENPEYSEASDELAFKNAFIDDSSAVLKISPYVDMVYPEIGKNVKAVLLEGYHSGTLNTSDRALRRFCKESDKRGVPVFLTGACSGFYYESKMLYDDLKIRVLPAASPIAMYIKLKLLDIEKIDNVFFPCGGDFV